MTTVRSIPLGRALDRFLGDMARRNCSERSCDDYFAHLIHLYKAAGSDATTAAVTPDLVREALDVWNAKSPGTRYKVDAMFRSFCKWLYEQDLVDDEPMRRIPRPKRLRPEDQPLRAVSGADVRRLFDACETWRDFLCLSTLAYLGARRGAASRLKVGDIDFSTGWAVLHEKGGKIHEMPLHPWYIALIKRALSEGAIADDPDAYVIPMLRPQRRQGERDARVVWRLIRNLGRRAGVNVFPHALRHAFSVRFLEQHPGEIEALQRVLNHSKIETTQRYLHAMDRDRLKERVRDLSWGTRFEANSQEAPSGIEPLYEALQASA